MEGINASAGGTNKPKKMGGTTYAAGGGSIDEMSRQQQKLWKVEDKMIIENGGIS